MLKRIMIVLFAATMLAATSAAMAMSKKNACVSRYDSSGVPVAPYCH